MHCIYRTIIYCSKLKLVVLIGLLKSGVVAPALFLYLL
jgi:hypothetical protein